ncbi:MAG: hypothetical protein II049_07475 [Clostridia bacterium]|nr:hypothetical protein [Clostridia bacterium]
MLFDSLDKLKRNSIFSAILLTTLGAVVLLCPQAYIPMLTLIFGSCLLCLVDLQPKTSNGMPLVASGGIIFSIALAIYSVGKLSKK